MREIAGLFFYFSGMKKFITEVRALNPNESGRRIYSYYGPVIEAENTHDAEKYCVTHGLGYCNVLGLFIKDINCGGSVVATLYYNKDRDN